METFLVRKDPVGQGGHNSSGRRCQALSTSSRKAGGACGQVPGGRKELQAGLRWGLNCSWEEGNCHELHSAGLGWEPELQSHTCSA